MDAFVPPVRLHNCPAAVPSLQGSPEEGAVILLALKYGDDAAELAPWLASLPESGLGWGALTDEQAAALQCPELVRSHGTISEAYALFTR